MGNSTSSGCFERIGSVIDSPAYYSRPRNRRNW